MQVFEHHGERDGRDQGVAQLGERGEPGRFRRGWLDVGFPGDLDARLFQRGAPWPQRRRGFRGAVTADDRWPGGLPDGLVDEPALPDAGRPADQQDTAWLAAQLVTGRQVSGQDAEFPTAADERDTRRDGGHASSIAQACVPGFSGAVQ